VTLTGALNPFLAISALNDHSFLLQLIEAVYETLYQCLWDRILTGILAHPFCKGELTIEKISIQQSPAG
jgi:hypothetical protein